MKLVIVESPSKCSKIESFLGPGYRCVATQGHICDVPDSLSWFDVSKAHVPLKVIARKKKTVAMLRKRAQEADEIFLATDPDREGEAIAFHIIKVLRLKAGTTKRLLFHEITREAVQHAVVNPCLPRIHLYEAQQSRRVIDLVFGFTVSPRLWRAIGGRGLSAGRCQSPCLHMILQQETKHRALPFTTRRSCTATFQKGAMTATLTSKFTADDPEAWLRDLMSIKSWRVEERSSVKEQVTPPKPFTTSSLQQKCFTLWKWPPSKTMAVAQKLYESGRITYIRTDSHAMSLGFEKETKKIIEDQFGRDYVGAARVRGSTPHAQEAHECIRPTCMTSLASSVEEPQLYDLIWKTTMASLMASGIDECLTVLLGADSIGWKWKHCSRKVHFDGFRKVMKTTEEEEVTTVPVPVVDLQVGEILAAELYCVYDEMTLRNRPYHTSDVIKLMEEKGLGRPSTYSSIITRLEDKGYVKTKQWSPYHVEVPQWSLKHDETRVEKKVRKQEIGKDLAACYQVSEVGKKVDEWMTAHLAGFLSEEFTCTMETELNEVAGGTRNYWDVVKEFHAKLSSSG